MRGLFDLAADPLESSDRSEEQRALADRLRAQLKTFLEETGNTDLADKSRIEPDETTLEKLRALGYIQ